jgi:hydrogenase maturation protease
LAEHDFLQTTLILGVGNIIMSDEGFGVHVVRKLKEVELPSNVKVEEGGVGGFNLLAVLEGIQRVIVVDVMMMDLAPGEICLFKPGPGFREPGKNILSFHQVGVPELVSMWGLLGHEPEIYLLVTRPEKLAWGMELSPSVAEAAEKAVALLQDICRDNFVTLERSISECTL